MFNPQAPTSEVSTRALVFRQALAAAFKSRRQNLPPAPASLPALLAGCQGGTQGLLGKPGCRDALGEIRACLFHTPGRGAEAQAWWHESVASAVFAARLAQLEGVSVPAAFLGALLHRSGDALALKILARVELDYRMKLDGGSRRDWCATHSPELAERLVRTWNLSPQVGACVLGWNRFGDLAAGAGPSEAVVGGRVAVAPVRAAGARETAIGAGETAGGARETAAVYFGRLFAIEFLQPQFCVPGALDHAAAEMGLSKDRVAQVRQEDVRSLIRALD
jgi:HDOD domain